LLLLEPQALAEPNLLISALVEATIRLVVALVFRKVPLREVLALNLLILVLVADPLRALNQLTLPWVEPNPFLEMLVAPRLQRPRWELVQ